MWVHRYNAQGRLCKYIHTCRYNAQGRLCGYIDIMHRAAYVGTCTMYIHRYNAQGCLCKYIHRLMHKTANVSIYIHVDTYM